MNRDTGVLAHKSSHRVVKAKVIPQRAFSDDRLVVHCSASFSGFSVTQELGIRRVDSLILTQFSGGEMGFDCGNCLTCLGVEAHDEAPVCS